MFSVPPGTHDDLVGAWRADPVHWKDSPCAPTTRSLASPRCPASPSPSPRSRTGTPGPPSRCPACSAFPAGKEISPQLENERSRLEEAALPEDSPPFTGQTACRRSRRRKTRGVRAIPTAWHWPTGRTRYSRIGRVSSAAARSRLNGNQRESDTMTRFAFRENATASGVLDAFECVG